MNHPGEQVEWRRSCDQLSQFLRKRSALVALREKYHPRLGAELASSHGERSVKSGGNAFSTLSQRARQDEDGIRAAHFRIERNRFGTRRGYIHQYSSCRA